MEKINVAELLKDCPMGMELDCTIWDNVVFDHVDMKSDYPIYIKKMGGEEYLTEEGCFNFDLGAKCVIYPKGKTTWEGFVPPCKFKVGDRVRYKDDKTIMAITGIKDNYYFVQFYNIKRNDYQNEKISFKDQDKYELDSHKFDINTLKPFDKVLVRTKNFSPVWTIDFYDGYQPNIGGSFTPFGVTSGQYFQQCIPYEGNEHLRGTTNDCDEYFKTWKN